jgi:hypothetical protein
MQKERCAVADFENVSDLAHPRTSASVPNLGLRAESASLQLDASGCIRFLPQGINAVMNRNNDAEGRYMLLPNRRRFVQGLAAGGAMAALDSGGWHAFGEATPQTSPTLTGETLS